MEEERGCGSSRHPPLHQQRYQLQTEFDKKVSTCFFVHWSQYSGHLVVEGYLYTCVATLVNSNPLQTCLLCIYNVVAVYMYMCM